jgi:serralysin
MPRTIFPSGNQGVDALLWGYAWDNPNLTYSFPTSAADYAYSGGITGFEAFSAFQKAMATKAIRNFDDVCGLKLTLTTVAGAGNLRFAEATTLQYFQGGPIRPPGNPPEPGTAEAVPPDPNLPNYAHGDSWFNHQYYNNPRLGGWSFAAGVMHELGHAVGLKHGHTTQDAHGITFPKLPAAFDGQEFSVMTYNGSIGLQNGFQNTSEFPQTLMMFDIAALQYMYGADYTTRATATVYSFSPTTGEMFINGATQGATFNAKIFLTLWDGGGTDTIDFSRYATNALIDLRPGFWSTPSSAQRAEISDNKFARGCIANALLFNNDMRSLIENAIGGQGNDKIVGNQAGNRLDGRAGNDTIYGASGADTLIGSSGNDLLDGGVGRDFLLGGSGVDRFDFNSVADSSGVNASLRDVIMDFSRDDVIDVSTIDARPTLTGNQALSFVVNFTGVAGQLQYDKILTTEFLVTVDLNGDRIADFGFVVRGVTTLVREDFIL